jgi:hypothetical protein
MGSKQVSPLPEIGTMGLRWWRTGNRLTVRILRHSQRKRGAPARPNLRSTAPVFDPTNREIRVENALTDENGERVRLKPGAEVDVILEADTDATTKKPD